jgi:hypothetical protein
LAMVDRMWTDAGLTIITRDTDGVALLASPKGGEMTCSDGSVVRVGSWEQVDERVARFDVLDPFGDGRAFWTVDRGTQERPLHILSLGKKRYVKARRFPHGWEAIGGTEHSLGGGVVDPPAMRGRDAERRHLWTYPVAKHALDRATAVADGRPPPRFDAPWDSPNGLPFPVLRGYTAASPTTLAGQPEALGAHPFAPIVEAHPDQLLAGHAETPVALDPGTDLSDWETLRFHDRYGLVRITTAGIADGHTVPLQTLRAFAEDWTKPREPTDPGEVVIDHRLIRRVGRGGALIDAQLAGEGVNASDHQVVYDEGDAAAFVQEEAQRLGKRAFSDRSGLPLSVAGRAALGKPISQRSVDAALRALLAARDERPCALEGCNHPVARPNALYCPCCPTHKDRAYRRRRKFLRSPVASANAPADLPACRECGVIMLGAADRGGICSKCKGGT